MSNYHRAIPVKDPIISHYQPLSGITVLTINHHLLMTTTPFGGRGWWYKSKLVLILVFLGFILEHLGKQKECHWFQVIWDELDRAYQSWHWLAIPTSLVKHIYIYIHIYICMLQIKHTHIYIYIYTYICIRFCQFSISRLCLCQLKIGTRNLVMYWERTVTETSRQTYLNSNQESKWANQLKNAVAWKYVYSCSR